MRRYREVEEADPGDSDGPRFVRAAVSAVFNLAGVALLLVAGAWVAAAAWISGELAVFPFFASLRQALEHRDEDASPDVDYRIVDHGPVNRLFGDGPVASTLGSAGFNRHALHHWEPQVSCTRLRDLEAFLMETELETTVAERRTTYARTFVRLFRL